MKQAPKYDLMPKTDWLMECDKLKVLLSIDSVYGIWYDAKFLIKQEGVHSIYPVKGFQNGDFIPLWYFVDSIQSDVFSIEIDRPTGTIKTISLKAIDNIVLCDSLFKNTKAMVNRNQNICNFKLKINWIETKTLKGKNVNYKLLIE